MGILKLAGNLLAGTAKLAGKATLLTAKVTAKGVTATGKVIYEHREEIGNVAAKTAKVAGTTAAVIGYGGYKAGKWATVKIAEHRHEIGGAVHGAASGVGGALFDASGHAFAGEKNLRPLIERLASQSAEYRDKVGSLYRRMEHIPPRMKRRDVVLDSTFVAGETLANYSTLAADVPADVERAFQLAYPGLAAKTDFAETVRRMDDADELQGLASGVKGKLFEIQYVEYLNDGHLPAGYTAALAKSATQTGWDIQILGPDGHLKEVIQAKATDSANYVQEALERYTHIDVVTTSEVHSQLVMQGFSEQVIDSGISESALQQMVEGAADGAAIHFTWMPSALSLALIAFSTYSQEGLNAYEKSRNFGKGSASHIWHTWLEERWQWQPTLGGSALLAGWELDS